MYKESYQNLDEQAREMLKQQQQSVRENRQKQKQSGIMQRISSQAEVESQGESIDSIMAGYISDMRQSKIEGVASFSEDFDFDSVDFEVPESKGSNKKIKTDLTKDKAFMSQLNSMKKKYPSLTENELFGMIKGESGFNPTAQNKDSGAAGLFQFIPSVAKELGYSTKEILNMSPAEQLKVYDKYLSKWNYSGNNSLGIVQAAPAYANKPPNTVVYKKGSKAWKQNPGWVPSDGGDITVASINSYYRNQ